MMEIYTEIRYANKRACFRQCNSVCDVSRCDTDWSCETVNVFRDSEKMSGTTFNTEDVFLAKRFWAHRAAYESRLPTFAQAQAFSVETMYYKDPTWVHKVWRYLHPINAIELLAVALAHYPIQEAGIEETSFIE
jgi:hypothetical protein